MSSIKNMLHFLFAPRIIEDDEDKMSEYTNKELARIVRVYPLGSHMSHLAVQELCDRARELLQKKHG